MAAADGTRPYRAEFGAIHHEDAPGFLFTVNPAHAADEVARAMNIAHRLDATMLKRIRTGQDSSDLRALLAGLERPPMTQRALQRDVETYGGGE
ncbi:MAG: hypothetical protein DI552_00375 [Brevundimonas sp.]|nr:MAG: hypothetical protein DI552_00375 [Brevundimonas sp.]